MARASAAFNIIFGAKTGKLSKDLKGVQRQMTILQRNLQQSGRKLTAGLTAPLAAIGASSFKVAADFESSMARVAAVSGATGASFERLRNLAQELGRTTVFTASEVAQLQESFARLGFTSSEIEQVTAATLNLAQASGSDLARAADVAGSTLRAFELDASRTGQVTDVMAKSFSTTALDMDAFAEAMKLVAPVANSAGLSIEETTALLGTLSNAGIRGSSAGTALRRIISELGTTSGDVSGEIKKLAAEGLNLADAKDEVGRNAQSALLVLANGVDDTANLTEAFNNAGGSAADMAAIMNDTAAGSMKRMQSAVEGAQIALGTALAPAVTSVAEKIGELAESFSNLGEDTQKAIVNFGLFAAALGPVKIALSGFVGGLKSAIKYSKQLVKFLAANPYVLAAAAIAAVGYAVYEYATATDAAGEAQRRVQAVSKQAQDNYIQEAAQVKALSDQYKFFQDDLEQREAILNQLQQVAPGYFDDLDAETAKYEDLANAVSGYLDEIRQAAIQKAFGDELVNVTAEELRVAEELRAAAVNLDKKKKDFRDVEEAARRQAPKEGFDPVASAANRLRIAQDDYNELLRESEVLNEEKLLLLEKIQRAQGDVVEGVRTENKERNEGTKTQETRTRTQTTVDVKPIEYDTTNDELERVMAQLADAENAALAAGELTGDSAQMLDELADAYTQAALGAQELLQFDLSQQLMAEAEAFRQNADAARGDAEAIRKALEERLYDLETDVAIKLSLDGDSLAAFDALAQGYKQLALEAQALGDTELASALYAQAEAFTAQGNAAMAAAEQTKLAAQLTQEALNGIAQGAMAALQQVGSGFVQANENYRQGIRELRAAFDDQQMTAEEYADKEKQLEKERQIARGEAAAQAIDTFLAEAIAALVSAAIKSAAATGPGAIALAPVLATAASGLVRSLFSAQIPAFAEGGAVTSGPTLALLGDNPSGKEMVVPFEKLPQFLNMFQSKSAETIRVHGVLHGRDIHLSSVKSTRYVQRTNASMAF